MALRNKSLLLYGLEVTVNNRSLDFEVSAVQKLATLQLGYYSLTSLMTEIERAMNAADPSNEYTVTADRTINGGTENRITVSTNGSSLSLLFTTGPRAASSCGSLIGFSGDQTGSTSYTGTSTAGIAIIPEYIGYTFLDSTMWRKNFGVTTITASGEKESIVYNIQKFISIMFKYEPEAKVIAEWLEFVDWTIQQKPFDFTPDYVLSPTEVRQVTLDQTPEDGKGMAWKWKEMLPNFPFNYETGALKFRIRE